MMTLPCARKRQKSWGLFSHCQSLIHSGDRPPFDCVSVHSDPAWNWKRLISDPLSTDERTALITSIFSDFDEIEVEIVGRLSGGSAQTFVDKIDEVNSHPISRSKAKWPLLIPSLFSIRHWIASHPRSEGGVFSVYPGFATAKTCFQDHS